MAGRCATCGGRLDEDGICGTCELEPVELGDPEAGIRREDRWVALPPGPVWVRRRTRRESPIGPFVALAAAIGVLALLVVLAPADDTAQRNAAPPRLDEPVGVVLYRQSASGIEEFDVDAGTVRSVERVPDGARMAPAEATTVAGTSVRAGHAVQTGTGEWWFVVTPAGAIDAIRADGSRFRLPIASRATEQIAIVER